MNLEAIEKGAKSYKTLKSYTKDELIEEIRILESNYACMEENYNRVLNLNQNIMDHFPDIEKWTISIFNDNFSNWKLLTQRIGTNEDCYKSHKGTPCNYCQVPCEHQKK